MTKKEKKSKEKKLGNLLLLLFVSVVMLATSTYAWFTSNRTVTVSSINVNVSASSGLQVSSNAADWKTIISNTELTTGYAITTGGTLNDKNQLPATLSPVSTAGVPASGYLGMFKGSVLADASSGDFELTAEAAAAEAKGTSGDFIAFDLFIKLDTASDIYLQRGSGVSVTSGKTDKGLQYATRIALVKEGTLAATSTQYALANQFGASATTAVTIIEPNADGHTSTGVANAKAYYTKYGSTVINGLSAGTGNTTVPYDGIKAAISSGIVLSQTNSEDNGTYFSRVTTIPTTVAFGGGGTGDHTKLFTSLPAGVTKFRVYMWIEGQDVDCENSASGADLTFDLAFTLDSKSGS